jgi:DnaK suppressor protein
MPGAAPSVVLRIPETQAITDATGGSSALAGQFVTHVGLSAADVRYFERLLNDRQRALNLQLQDLVLRKDSERNEASRGEVHDTKEQSAFSQLAEASAAELLRLREELSGIDAALERMAAGRFGICTQCGSPIAQDRLTNLPGAVRCRPCQGEHEQPKSTH